MTTDLKVPDVGESITEVEIGEWMIQEGDSAKQDEVVVVIDTDKASVEVVAPVAGKVTEILKQTGDTAEVGEVIGKMEASDGDEGGKSAKKSKQDTKQDTKEDDKGEDGQEQGSRAKDRGDKSRKSEAKSRKDAQKDSGDEDAGDDQEKRSRKKERNKSADTKKKQRKKKQESARKKDTGDAEDASDRDDDDDTAGADRDDDGAKERGGDGQADGGGRSQSSAAATQDTRVMPAARRLLEKHDLEADEVKASGPGGRLLKEDVLRHVHRPKSPAEPEQDPDDYEQVVPMSSLRRRIAERLVGVQQAAALLTTFNEIDMSAVVKLRKEHKETFLERHGVKLGFMGFFVKAAVDALKLVPAINTEIRDQNIVYKNHFDIGIAVGGGKGLVVPVLRNADRMSFAEVEQQIGDFAKRAQNNKITLDELQGGTFTISNGGVYGSLLSTPIVNPPQSGILGLHAIQDRPAAVGGEVVVRPMMYVALTYDHRVVDGREAVTFLKRIKETIETPSRILLEV